MRANSESTAVIVIGSGFAGAAVADQLVRAGIPVTMLERGPWRDTVPVRSMGISDRTPFPRGAKMWTRTFRSIQHPWLPSVGRLGSKHGLVELIAGKGVSAICSSGVGGGSHVYSGVFRFPRVSPFWDGFVDNITDEAMKPRYERILRRFDAVEPSADLKIPHSVAERFSPTSPVRAPAEVPPTWLAFKFPDQTGCPKKVRTLDGIERWEVDYDDPDGHGFLGSPSGAKTSVDFLYLAPLMSEGLVVRDLCEVTGLIANPEGSRTRFRVVYENLKTGQRETIQSDHVVLAAGTLNTLRLLLKSRDVDGTLSAMPELGKGFGGNGDYFAFWDLNESKRDLSTGLPFHGGMQLADERYSKVLGGGGWPAVHKYPLPGRLRERLSRAAFVSSMGIDAMDGSVSFRDGRLRIEFNADNSPIYRQTRSTFRRLGDVTKTRVIYPRNPFTVHPLGGARIGRSANCGVVNGCGQVHEYNGLYIADGSVFPRLPGGPPTLALMGWAEHIGMHLAETLRTTTQN